MSVTGEADGPPRAGRRLADRLRDGAVGGDRHPRRAARARAHRRRPHDRHVALRDGALAARRTTFAAFAETGVAPGRHGSAFPLIAPYEVFPTSDGELMIVGRQRRLCRAAARRARPAGRRAVRDESRPGASNREALVALLVGAAAQRTSAVWEAALADAGVPGVAAARRGEAFAHEQTRALGILQQLGAGTTVAPPLSVDGERSATARRRRGSASYGEAARRSGPGDRGARGGWRRRLAVARRHDVPATTALDPQRHAFRHGSSQVSDTFGCSRGVVTPVAAQGADDAVSRRSRNVSRPRAAEARARAVDVALELPAEQPLEPRETPISASRSTPVSMPSPSSR